MRVFEFFGDVKGDSDQKETFFVISSLFLASSLICEIMSLSSSSTFLEAKVARDGNALGLVSL